MAELLANKIMVAEERGSGAELQTYQLVALKEWGSGGENDWLAN